MQRLHFGPQSRFKPETPFWAAAVAVGSGGLKLGVNNPRLDAEQIESGISCWHRDVALQLTNVVADITDLRSDAADLRSIVEDTRRHVSGMSHMQSWSNAFQGQEKNSLGISDMHMLHEKIRAVSAQEQDELRHWVEEYLRTTELQSAIEINRALATKTEEILASERACRSQLSSQIAELREDAFSFQAFRDRVDQVEKSTQNIYKQMHDASCRVGDLEAKQECIANMFARESNIGRKTVSGVVDTLETLKRKHSDLETLVASQQVNEVSTPTGTMSDGDKQVPNTSDTAPCRPEEKNDWHERLQESFLQDLAELRQKLNSQEHQLEELLRNDAIRTSLECEACKKKSKTSPRSDTNISYPSNERVRESGQEEDSTLNSTWITPVPGQSANANSGVVVAAQSSRRRRFHNKPSMFVRGLRALKEKLPRRK